MTIQQIVLTLKPHKPVSRATVYTYLKRLKIKPIGARQKPMRYPEDSADKILTDLGLPKIVSMPRLRSERSRRAR